MKLKHQPILAAMTLSFAVSIAPAQTISYAYDSSGNRISRELRMNAKSMPKQTVVEQAYVQEILSERSIYIHPNPTKGIISVEVVEYENKDNGKIDIFNLSGRRLLSKPLNSACVTLDLSSADNGIYILHISLNGSCTSWKIIKE